MDIRTLTGDAPNAKRVSALDVDQQENREEEEENDSEDSEDSEEDDDEEEEEDPEEIARRLGDQLWADIQRARAGNAVETTANAGPATQQPTATSTAPNVTPAKPSIDPKKQEAALTTMKVILAHAETDSLVLSTLKSTKVPGYDDSNVYDTLKGIVTSGSITKHAAGSLSQVLVRLAKSEVLFPPLPALPSSLLKRKREVNVADALAGPAQKRPANNGNASNAELEAQVMTAVGDISKTLEVRPNDEKALSSSVIATIQPQLHQVFLFAVTSSAAVGDYKFALQEASGLIQILGVLSGILIIPPAPENSASGSLSGSTDIITAVYPCLHLDCSKTFSRLYSLRQHQRTHPNLSTINRPYKCDQCPASFSRNHDLKRHIKVHEKIGFQCGGCGKIFSRRDAIKRHKKQAGTAARNGLLMDGRMACENAGVEEVNVDGIDGLEDAKEDRRARMWNGMHSAPLPPAAPGEVEEGEISQATLVRTQAAVATLVPLLQAHVARALGAGNITHGVQTPQSTLANNQQTTSAGQATLASVIARATAPVTDSTHTPSVANDVEDSQVQLPSSTIALGPPTTDISNGANALSGYVLNADQTKLLEQAIAQATAAAQAQAEAEAALEEGDDDEEDGVEEEEEEDMDVDTDT